MCGIERYKCQYILQLCLFVISLSRRQKYTEHAQPYSLINVSKSERNPRVKGNAIRKGIEVISL